MVTQFYNTKQRALDLQEKRRALLERAKNPPKPQVPPLKLRPIEGPLVKAMEPPVVVEDISADDEPRAFDNVATVAEDEVVHHWAKKQKLETRFNELVNKKHQFELTPEEQDELRALNQELDKLDERFYRPVIDRLEANIDEAGNSNSDERSRRVTTPPEAPPPAAAREEPTPIHVPPEYFSVPSDTPQPCGHPISAIVSSGEGTNYCGTCARLNAAADEALYGTVLPPPGLDRETVATLRASAVELRDALVRKRHDVGLDDLEARELERLETVLGFRGFGAPPPLYGDLEVSARDVPPWAAAEPGAASETDPGESADAGPTPTGQEPPAMEPEPRRAGIDYCLSCEGDLGVRDGIAVCLNPNCEFYDPGEIRAVDPPKPRRARKTKA